MRKFARGSAVCPLGIVAVAALWLAASADAAPKSNLRVSSLGKPPAVVEAARSSRSHAGAVCEFTLARGESTRIVAKVKPSESLSHWASLGLVDDDLDNEDVDPVNVVVKPKRRHR